MKPTPEQQVVIDDPYVKGSLVAIEAFAGTGKTTTLEAIANAHNDKRFLYLAYNRAIAAEAKARFPRNTTCMTVHGLAYRRVGYRHKDRLGTLRVNDLIDAGVVRRMQMADAFDALASVGRWMVSNDREITPEHCARKADLVEMARTIWQAIIEGKVPMPHDAYVKMWVLEGANLGAKYDVVLLDEAQDSNPITSEGIVMPLCRKGESSVAIVGDQYQSIYQWRGAVNAMAKLSGEAAATYRLTTSFRFGQEIADLASHLLNSLRSANVALSGVDSPVDDGSVAVLGRSNASIIRYAYGSGGGTPVHFAGTDERSGWSPRVRYRFQEFEDLAAIRKGKLHEVRTPHLRVYAAWSEVREIADAGVDPEISASVSIVEDFGDTLRPVLRALEQRATSPANAEMTCSTAHAAKGLEWANVQLLSGFLDVSDPEKVDKVKKEGKFEEETNLIYVAATRARQKLQLSPELTFYLRGSNEGYAIVDRLAGGINARQSSESRSLAF